MTSIVVNRCYGKFGLSLEGMIRYCELINLNIYHHDQGYYFTDDNKLFDMTMIPRDHPALLQTYYEMRFSAGDDMSYLIAVDIPNDYIDWFLQSNHGYETIIATNGIAMGKF